MRPSSFAWTCAAGCAPVEAENIPKSKVGSEIIYSSQAARKHSENAVAHLDQFDGAMKLIGTGESPAFALV